MKVIPMKYLEKKAQKYVTEALNPDKESVSIPREKHANAPKSHLILEEDESEELLDITIDHEDIKINLDDVFESDIS